MSALIDRLIELAEWADANEWEVPIDLGDTIMEAVERLKRMKWIPVDEKKPEPYETVIVSVATRNGYEEPISLETLAAYERRSDVWQDGLDGSPVTKADYERVTHWMPLPEPPEANVDGK